MNIQTPTLRGAWAERQENVDRENFDPFTSRAPMMDARLSSIESVLHSNILRALNELSRIGFCAREI